MQKALRLQKSKPLFDLSSSMAEVSYLNNHGEDEENDDVVVSFSPHNLNWSQDLDGFDVCPSDLDFPSTEYFFARQRRRRDRVSQDNASDPLDQESQVNFVIDMFHQRVEQSHSSSRVIVETDLVGSDRSLGVIEGNEDMNSNDLEMDFGSGLGLGFVSDDDDDDSGFMFADCGDEFFLSRRTRGSGGARSESGGSSSGSVGPAYYMGGLSVTDSDEAGENEIIGVDDDVGINGGCDDEASLRICWDAFQLEDDDHIGGDATANQHFEWEEVDARTDEREVLSMFLNAEADSYVDDLEWEVFSNVHNLEANPAHAEADNYAAVDASEWEVFFNVYNLENPDFADNLVQPPASKRVVESLVSVVMTLEDVENNNTLCAICKDEIGVGETAKQLPCTHRYHGDCIVPWLCIRNTCPVCRHELLTDDPDYERRKAERVASIH